MRQQKNQDKGAHLRFQKVGRRKKEEWKWEEKELKVIKKFKYLGCLLNERNKAK